MVFKSDIFQIAPAETGSRLIRSEPSTGKLKFYDPNATSGITLSQLAGIAVSDIYIVAPSGTGAAYTNLTDAMTAVRASTGTSHLILVFPGTYIEVGSVIIDRDNVTIYSFGGATIGTVASDHVFTIKQTGSYIPSRVGLKGLRINSIVSGKAGVYISGGAASTVGLKGITLEDCEWVTATGTTALAIWALTSNHIRVTGGTMKECLGPGSKVLVTTCSSFTMDGVVNGAACQLDYTNAGDEPSDSATPLYKIKSSTIVSLTSTLTNKGELDVEAVDGKPAVYLQGTQYSRFLGSCLGAVDVRNTSKALFSGTSYTSMANDATVTGTEPVLTGTSSLTGGATTKTVTLPYTQPDTNYVVTVSMTVGPFVTWGITTKTTTQFIVTFSASDAGARDFDWTLTRVVKA